MVQSAFKFELTGLKELEELLKQLPTQAMKKAVVRNALKKAAKPVAEAMKANAPYDPSRGDGKHLRDTITVSTTLKASQKRGKALDGSRVEVYVGSSAPHAHLIEFGTVERTRKKRGPTGHVPAMPFARTAWETTKDQALRILSVEIWNELKKAAARLAGKAVSGKLGKAQFRGLLK